MINAGIIKLRYTKGIRKKISDYEDKFKSTRAWDTATRARVKECDGAETFNEVVTEKNCLGLEEMYADRASIKPLLTTNEIED